MTRIAATRVTVRTDQLRRTRIVQIGSGFLSQHSKELLFGLGKSRNVLEATIVWPFDSKNFRNVERISEAFIPGLSSARKPVSCRPASRPGCARRGIDRAHLHRPDDREHHGKSVD